MENLKDRGIGAKRGWRIEKELEDEGGIGNWERRRRNGKNGG